MNNAEAALALAGMGVISAVAYVIEGDRSLIAISAVMLAAAGWQLSLVRK